MLTTFDLDEYVHEVLRAGAAAKRVSELAKLDLRSRVQAAILAQDAGLMPKT